jgi:predicted TPR repeat methyltransferase
LLTGTALHLDIAAAALLTGAMAAAARTQGTVRLEARDGASFPLAAAARDWRRLPGLEPALRGRAVRRQETGALVNERRSSNVRLFCYPIATHHILAQGLPQS